MTTGHGMGDFTDDAWTNVLAAVDRTYADLVAHQEMLERQSEELHELRRFVASVPVALSRYSQTKGGTRRRARADMSLIAGKRASRSMAAFARVPPRLSTRPRRARRAVPGRPRRNPPPGRNISRT